MSSLLGREGCACSVSLWVLWGVPSAQTSASFAWCLHAFPCPPLLLRGKKSASRTKWLQGTDWVGAEGAILLQAFLTGCWKQCIYLSLFMCLELRARVLLIQLASHATRKVLSSRNAYSPSPLSLSHSSLSGILQPQRELIFTCSISCGAVGCDNWRWRRLFSPFLLHLSFPGSLKRVKIVIIIFMTAWLRFQSLLGRESGGLVVASLLKGKEADVFGGQVPLGRCPRDWASHWAVWEGEHWSLWIKDSRFGNSRAWATESQALLWLVSLGAGQHRQPLRGVLCLDVYLVPTPWGYAERAVPAKPAGWCWLSLTIHLLTYQKSCMYSKLSKCLRTEIGDMSQLNMVCEWQKDE